MGSFINIADLEQKFQNLDLVRLSRDDGSSDVTIDSAVINDAIFEAESIIKMYIQSRYSLPFNQVPVVIKRFSKQLTYYILAERKGLNKDNLQVMYENVIESLKSIQKGFSTLDTFPGTNDFQTGKVYNAHVEDTDFEIDDLNIEGIL